MTNDPDGLKVLIIGASGYVGRSITRTLRGAGHRVAGIARNQAAAGRVVENGAAPIHGDLNDPATIVAHLPAFDAIVFAPQIERGVERRAVEILLAALAGSGKRFIFTSGTAVLSRRTDGEWIEDNYGEDDPFNGSLERNQRVQTEMLVRAAAERGVSTAVIRPPMIWGHGRCPPIAALHSSARTGAICYLGRGLCVYSTIHVDDLADIFLLAIEKGAPGALYHAVSGETNWRSLAERIAVLRGLPTRSVDFAEAERLFGPFLAPIVFASNSRTRCPRTRNELGWSPHPDRLDLFAELAHPTFMAIDTSDGERLDFTLAELLQKGRSEG